ncbi:4Fe-4S binding protein [Adlercreutzia equolifaciens]|uniref:4Fe-4S binding protein n=1 Tax=Adlercreutzia equolifaciens TaxID=446660 RepID=UPI0023B14623|nr:4Fe-4S binding protein [Adlercreutzia equolifaciens]MDE8701986.1 4Fe-4S binding protein [Adlercreutzia equolifaciens]
MVERIDAAAHRHVGTAFTAVDSAAIRVHRERCAKVRNRNVDCLKCAAACTSGCISLVEGELVIDAVQCVGCGTCATVCPTCALESLNPSDAQLKAACVTAASDAAVVIACSQAVAALEGLLVEGSCAEVVCAGRVDESLLAGLAAEGVAQVTVLCGACDRCAQRHGRATAELVAETTRLVLDAWGTAMAVTVTDVPSASVLREGVAVADALSARDGYFAEERACEPLCAAVEEGAPPSEGALVESRADGAAPAENDAVAQANEVDASAPISLSSPEAEAADVTAGPGLRFYWNSGHSRKVSQSMHVMKDGTLPHFLPDRRERLLDALAQLGEPKAAKLACRLWGAVVIDGAKCESCRMCATFCPTGAIAKFDEADGTLGVTHTPGDCVKCGSCQDICPTDAITLLDEVPTAWLVNGEKHRYAMAGRPVSLTDNPHQILDTFRLDFNGDIFER